jgi:hypothetical protein
LTVKSADGFLTFLHDRCVAKRMICANGSQLEYATPGKAEDEAADYASPAALIVSDGKNHVYDMTRRTGIPMPDMHSRTHQDCKGCSRRT